MPVVIVSGATNTREATVLWQQVTPTVTAGSFVSGYPPINVIDPNTWNSWRSGAGSRFIVFDFGEDTEVDAFGIAAHTIYETAGAVRIEYSTNGASFTGIHTYTPSSKDDILFLTPKYNYRYYRVTLTVAQANIGVIQIGKRLVFPSAPLDDYTPVNLSRRYTKLYNESISGQWLSNRVVSASAETSASFNPLSRAWVNNNIIPFKSHYDQGGTFFYAGCPQIYPLDMGYCKAASDEDTINIQYTEGSRLASVDFTLRAYVAQ